MDTTGSRAEISDEEWLKADSPVGIAFSGGGIRAASFALGVAQALQVRLGLIRGDRAARWLSCVSGGSYIAGAITLVNAGSRMRWIHKEDQGAADLPSEASPYQPGSPELRYMLRHTRYLVEDGAVSTFLALAYAVIVGLLSTVLVVVGGTAGLLLFFGLMGQAYFGALESSFGGVAAVIALVLFLGAVVGAMGAERAGLWWRLVLIVGLGAICLFTVPRLLLDLEVLALTSLPEWFERNAVAISLTSLGVLAGIVAGLLLGRIRGLEPLSSFATGLGGSLLRFVPLIGFIAAGAWVAALASRDGARWMEDFDRFVSSLSESSFWWLYILGCITIVTIGGAFFFAAPPAHVVYRDRLAKCFAIIRTDDGAKAAKRAETIHLSSLAPGPRVPLEELRQRRRIDDTGGRLPGARHTEELFAAEISAARAIEDAAAASEPTPAWVRYPELLICAAANVSGAGAAPSGGNVLPFIMSAKSLSLPTEGASLPMDITENRESAQVGLAAGMALSGAAVSPAMGRLTRENFRTMLAVLGVRLGVWLPNPLSPAAHAKYRERTYAGSSSYGPFSFLGELLGIHPTRMRNIYVTDGGHDENLGLIELLRRGCAEIWAVDASTDRPGRAPALVQAILNAEAELGCSIVLDLTQFGPDPDTGLHRHTFAAGTVTYANGRTAALRVLKLGLTSAHTSVLHEYARLDTSFPYHSTLRQIYSATRFDAYRRLGAETANLAIDACDLDGKASLRTTVL